MPVIRALLAAKVPTFGICLGHQMLALAVGARTLKMRHGHHGANHPVKDFTTGKVEIVSMNHGFAVDTDDAAENRTRKRIAPFSTARIAGSPSPTGRPFRCNIIPRPRPARATVIICSAASSRR